jgi:hypothetical protein
MNTVVLLPLQERLPQWGAGKYDQWSGYMTVPVFSNGMIKSISILTVVIRSMIKFEVDTPRDCFRQVLKRTLAIHQQLSTISVLYLDRVHQVACAQR